VKFVDLARADVDLLNDSIFSLVVPDLFTTLVAPPWPIRKWRQIRQAFDARARARAKRQAVRIPVRVESPTGDFVVAARDVSATGVSLMSPKSIAIGSTLRLSMVAPGHEWEGTVEVARCEARPSRAGFDTWLLGLRFVGERAPAAIAEFYRQDAA
jgi:hypothetical protein